MLSSYVVLGLVVVVQDNVTDKGQLDELTMS